MLEKKDHISMALYYERFRNNSRWMHTVFYINNRIIGSFTFDKSPPCVSPSLEMWSVEVSRRVEFLYGIPHRLIIKVFIEFFKSVGEKKVFQQRFYEGI